MATFDLSQLITAEMKMEAAQAKTKETFRSAIQTHIDTIAKSRDYDSGNSLASYAIEAEPNEQWRTEARAFVKWRSAVWEHVNAELEKVMNGIRGVPTVEEFIDELPEMDWEV